MAEMGTSTIGQLPGGEIWDASWFNTANDILKPSIAEALSLNYDELFKKRQLMNALSKLMGMSVMPITQTTHSWFQTFRYDVPPIDIATAQRCDADGTPNGSGAYVRANIATTSVYGGAGNYTSFGSEFSRVYVYGNQLDGEHYTVILKVAPRASNSGHYMVLQLNTGTTTTPAALVTEINGTGAKLVAYSQVGNDLTAPQGTPLSIPEKFTAYLQQTARKINFTNQLDTQRTWFTNTDGKQYMVGRLMYEGYFMSENDKDKQLILGERATTASPNEQSLQTTDGLLKTAKASNEFNLSYAMLLSGNANDYYSELDLLVEAVKDLSSAGQYLFLNGDAVQRAWARAISVSTKTTGAYLMVGDDTINAGGVVTKLRDYENTMALKYGGITFVNMAVPYMSDNYITNSDELPNKAIMLPLQGNKVYNIAAGETITAPTIQELAIVNSNGVRQSFKVGGPFSFDGPNPDPEGLNVHYTYLRRQFGFMFNATSQYALLNYNN